MRRYPDDIVGKPSFAPDFPHDPLDLVVQFNEFAGTECKYRSLDDDAVMFQKHLIDEEKKELDEAFENKDRKETLDALCDSIVVIAGMIHRLGYNPSEAMAVVSNSNMSKFVDTSNGDEIQQSLYKYDDSDRYVDISVDLTTGAVWGVDVTTGGRKILKGVNYQSPDWTQLDSELV